MADIVCGSSIFGAGLVNRRLLVGVARGQVPRNLRAFLDIVRIATEAAGVQVGRSAENRYSRD
jgi:hypothetical protein